MTRQEKDQIIDSLVEKLANNSNIYLTDVSELPVKNSNDLRRLFFSKGVEIQVVKNSLLKKAMEKSEVNFEEIYEVLRGNTALVFSETANLPAKLIKEFRKKSDKPILKAALVDSEFYLGDEQISTLAMLKSKNEIIGDIIGLLQSPAKNVISALKSGGSTISGILTTLGEREESAEPATAIDTKQESMTEDAAPDGKADETEEIKETKETEESVEETHEDVNVDEATDTESQGDEDTSTKA